MIPLFPRSGKVVIFGAHPDDAEFGAGGTLARLSKAGLEVTIVVASVPSLYDVRVAEAARGADVLGAKLEILFPQPCRVEDVPMHRLVAAMDAVIAKLNPSLVFVHSLSDLHWDHGLVTRAAMSSLRRTPSNLLAFSSSYDLNTQTTMGECFFDVTETIDVKIEALSAHKSQLKGIDVQGARHHAQAMGRKCGASSAEVFEVLRLTL